MDRPLFVPEDPLARFLALRAALAREKRWTHSRTWLRRAAVALVLCPGEPDDVARAVHALAAELEERAGWFGPLQSQVRFFVAASLLRRGVSAGRFQADMERAQARFREERLWRGGAHEALAILVLHERTGGAIAPEHVAQLAAVHREMKRHHPSLTGPDDYVASALLATSGEAPGAVSTRVERLYAGLREKGFARGNPLQLCSHLLFFHPASDDVACARFRDLYAAFKARKLWMNEGDYDEVALLSFLEHSAATVVDRVLAHRESIRAARPSPPRQESFSLACSMAFLDLALRDASLRRWSDAAALLQVAALVQAQQAAAAAAVAASTSAAAAG